MSGAFWPWWLSAGSLAVVTVGCCIVARRPLGVSGIVARFVNLRAEVEAERQRRATADADEAALEAALLAATADAFGVAPLAGAACAAAPDVAAIGAPPATAGDDDAPPASGGAVPKGCDRCSSADSRPTLGVHAAFLLAIVLGGLATQLARGAWRVRLDMGPEFHAHFGSGAGAWGALALGGVLVGIGTTLSGGCSTGHGLSGCSRLQPAGVAATVSFVGAAVAVSLVLQRSLS